MNLNSIASAATSAIVPKTPVKIFVSSGYTTDDSGQQIPKYNLAINAKADKQALSAGDIKRLEGLGIQGVTEKLYLKGNFEGIFREDGKGGDLIKIGDRTYLVTTVLERWPNWCSLALTLQAS